MSCRNRLRIAVHASLLVAALLLPVRAAAQQVEEAKLVAGDGAAFDAFGFSVSISGNALVVGTRLDDDAGTDSGSAYVYRFDGANWSEEAKLTASDGAAFDGFGFSVSISDDVLIVGAHRDDDAGSNSGSAYVYRFDGVGWNEEAKLTFSGAAGGDEFGNSVSISGDTAVVGARNDDDACLGDPGCESGSAHVYRFDGVSWNEEAKLTASDQSAFDEFGFSVSINGDILVVGAHNSDDACFPPDLICNSGSAYVYRFNGVGWIQEAKLTASDADRGDDFGSTVSISGDAIVVGAHRNSDANTWSGSAYVYHFNGVTWGDEAKLTASDATGNDEFGWSVSISGDTLVVGAFGDDDSGRECGSAYLFRSSGVTWTEEAKLVASDAAATDFLGWSVSISGGTFVVGAYLDDDAGDNSGSAYVGVVAGSAAGRITEVAPGSALTVNHGLGGQIDLSWGPSCMATDVDYAVYEGDLTAFPSHAPALCSTGGVTSASILPVFGAAYYLVVPLSGTSEGSYGIDSALVERPAAVLSCAPQTIGCP